MVVLLQFSLVEFFEYLSSNSGGLSDLAFRGFVSLLLRCVAELLLEVFLILVFVLIDLYFQLPFVVFLLYFLDFIQQHLSALGTFSRGCMALATCVFRRNLLFLPVAASPQSLAHCRYFSYVFVLA